MSRTFRAHVILCGGRCGVLSTIPGPHSLDPTHHPSPVETTKNVPRHLPVSPAGAESPQLRATGLVPALVSDSPFAKSLGRRSGQHLPFFRVTASPVSWLPASPCLRGALRTRPTPAPPTSLPAMGFLRGNPKKSLEPTSTFSSWLGCAPDPCRRPARSKRCGQFCW